MDQQTQLFHLFFLNHHTSLSQNIQGLYYLFNKCWFFSKHYVLPHLIYFLFNDLLINLSIYLYLKWAKACPVHVSSAWVNLNDPAQKSPPPCPTLPPGCREQALLEPGAQKLPSGFSSDFVFFVFAEKSSELVSTLLHIHTGSCPVQTHAVPLVITVHFHAWYYRMYYCRVSLQNIKSLNILKNWIEYYDLTADISNYSLIRGILWINKTYNLFILYKY